MKLSSWLERNKIKNIISIDDEHSNGSKQVNLEYYLEKGLKEQYEEFLSIFNYIKEFDNKMLEEYETIDEKINVLLDIYNDFTSNTYFMNALNKLIKEVYGEKSAITEFLKKVKVEEGDSLENIKLYNSYDEACSNYKEYIKGINKNGMNKVLWLVDYELVDGDSKRTGLNLIESIIVENQEDDRFLERNIFVLLSGFQIQNTEIGSMKCRIYKIDKMVLKDTETFIQSLINGSKEYMSWLLIRYINNTLNDGLKAAEGEILSRKQEILDYLIVYFPNKEGTHTLELLVRIIQIIAKGNFEDSISNDIDKLVNLLYEYEIICKDEEKIKSNYLFELMNRETVNKNINKFYNSINSGDVFCINNKQYVLLSQPCDISVRGKGERKLSNGVLAKISEVGSQSKAEYELRHFNENTCYIDYRDCKYVNLDILDLCTLNKEGTAKLHRSIFEGNYSEILSNLKLDKIEEKIEVVNDFFNRLILENKIEGYLNYPMRLKIFKILIKLNEIVNIFKSLKEENSPSFNKMRDIIKNESELISLYSYDISDDYIEFNVSRVASINIIDTYDIINEFSNYTSRLGKPGDITLHISDECKDIFIEDLTNGKKEFITKVKDGSNEEEIKRLILKLNSINANKIDNIDFNDKKVTITKDVQYIHIGKNKFEIQNGMIEISREFIKKINEKGVTNVILEEILKNKQNVKNIHKIFDESKNDIRDNIMLKVGKNKFGTFEIDIESHLDKTNWTNIGSIKIEKSS